MRLKSLTMFAVGLIVSTVARAAVIDFESLAQNDALIHDQGFSYSEDGFILNDLSSPYQFASLGALQSWFTGSTSLLNNNIGGQTELVKNNGGSFSLNSIDIAEMNVGMGAAQVSFAGYFLGGGTVIQTFQLDGVFGAQTFIFAGFNNVNKVLWWNFDPFHQFDNIVIDGGAAVPLPAASWLFLSGLLCLIAVRGKCSQRINEP